MAIPTSKPLSLSTVQTEYGGSNPISMSEYRSKGNAPATGAIDLWADFNGTSAIVNVDNTNIIYNQALITARTASSSPDYQTMTTGFAGNETAAQSWASSTALDGDQTAYIFNHGIKLRETSAGWVGATISNVTRARVYIYIDSTTDTDGYGNADSRHYVATASTSTFGAVLASAFALDATGGDGTTVGSGNEGIVEYDMTTRMTAGELQQWISAGIPTYWGFNGEETTGYNSQEVTTPAGRVYYIRADLKFDYQ